MHHRIVICSGGTLGDWALGHIAPDDMLIGADSGASFLIQNGLAPDISIGDFDSVSVMEMATIRKHSGKTISCDPIDKNYTDTEMAFRLALDMKPDELILLGGLGTRFDHSLSNVHLLALADENGVAASIIDERNVIMLISSTSIIRGAGHRQVSLLPLTEQATGITLTGFQYPLTNATLKIGMSLGISNVLLGDEGTIELTGGKLLVMRSRD
ncbi:thiamine diphosphokinase [Paenibacillus sp. GCM10027627]|uniref:thiamine diphosphokinase n=1 Tax=unclassified Paenibacillus TaxID=185978 RepID=UPI00362D45F8